MNITLAYIDAKALQPSMATIDDVLLVNIVRSTEPVEPSLVIHDGRAHGILAVDDDTPDDVLYRGLAELRERLRVEAGV